MIFEMHGHPKDQKDIVAETFGGLQCEGALNTAIARNLNKSWVDDNGLRFTSRVVAAYDPAQRINNLPPNFIRSELLANRPLLVCNTHHAMVNVTFEFWDASPKPFVSIDVGVLDPWPGSPAFHSLTAAELIPTISGGQLAYLAAVHVTE